MTESSGLLATHRGDSTPDVPASRDGPALVRRGLLRSFTLWMLSLQPTHGYQLRRRLEVAGLRPEPSGLYRLLHRLEREGHVESSSAGNGRGPGRRVYRLTASGVEQLKAEAEALEQVAELLRSFSSGIGQLVAVAEPAGGAPGTPIEEVGLAPRAAERLRRFGVRTLEEVVVLTEWKLLRQGLWVGDVRQIVAALARRGLSLRDGTLGGPPRNAGGAPTQRSLPRRSEPREGRPMRRSERDEAMVIARRRGDTLQEIGARFGVSRERVRQILVDANSADLGSAKSTRATRRLAAAEGRREEVLTAWRAGSGLQEIATGLHLSRAKVRGLIEGHATTADRAARRLVLLEAARRARPQGHSDEKLIEAVRRVAGDEGHVPTSKEYGDIAKAAGLPSLSTVENRFDGWNAAVRAAGLTPTRANPSSHRRWTEERCLEALRGLVAELGALPSQHEYEELSPRRPDLPSSATLRTRMGSWSRLVLRLERDACPTA